MSFYKNTLLWSQVFLKMLHTIGSFKRHWTPLVIVIDQYSHVVYPNVCMKNQTCENLGSIGHQSCKRIMKEKTQSWHNFVCFQMHFITINYFISQKLCYPRREQFLTMLNTLNSTPFHVTIFHVTIVWYAIDYFEQLQ